MPRADVSAQEFAALFDELRNWGRWGPDDERDALHLVTQEHVVAAARLVRDGRTVTLSLPLNTDRAIDSSVPADRHMTLVGEAAPATEALHFNKDYVDLDYHNDGHAHIDALSHVAYEGSLYNDRLEQAVTPDGATVDSIEVLRNGLIGHHVLAITAMGIHLLDYLQFEDFRVACAQAGRWEFPFMAAPLRITGGTGSPVGVP